MTRRALRATLRRRGGAARAARLRPRSPRHGDRATRRLRLGRADRPAGLPHRRPTAAAARRLGSFADWSPLVRDALIWLGEADPCDTMEELRGADPKLEALTSVLEGWREVIGLQPANVRDVIERATEQRPQLYGRAEFLHPEFREAPAAGRGRKAARSTAGGSASGSGSHQNRIVGGLRLVNAGVSAGVHALAAATCGAGGCATQTTVLKTFRSRADA